jgi:peptidyl-prolyl cis-trans isomerase A (cyclophilin A)
VQSAHATVVQFQTVLGNFSVNLYDKTTPKTVENFLAYVKSGAYNNSIIHRSVPGFIVQGGGYKYPLADAPKNPSVINEPVYANKRGTIAMAKLGGQPNSATNQWFFNLADNSATLDP